MYGNEYVGALDGVGNIDAHSYGSLSAKYCTRMGTSSSGSIFRIIFNCYFGTKFGFSVFLFIALAAIFCCRVCFNFVVYLVQKLMVFSLLRKLLPFDGFSSCTLTTGISASAADRFFNGLNLLCSHYLLRYILVPWNGGVRDKHKIDYNYYIQS